MLAAIIVAAILLRIVAIDAQGLWSDEAFTIVLADWSISDMFLLPTDPTPFLYYAIHKAFLPADASIAAIRSISVIAGVLSVGLMYVLGRLAYGKAGGLLAAALLAVWSIHVDYSQEARAYSLLFFFTLLTSVGFLYYANLLKAEGVGRNRLIALALFGIGDVLGFYTHMASVFWIALSCLMLFALVARAGRARLVEVGILFVVMALCALPGLLRLAEQLKIGDGFNWVRQPGLSGFIQTSLNVFLPAGLWDNTLVKTSGLASVAKIAVIAAWAAGLGLSFWLGRRQLLEWARTRRPVLWLILAYLMVPLIVWLYGFALKPLFISRVILYSAPGMILLITGLCLALDKRRAAWATIAVVVVYGAAILLQGTIRERENWRGAAEYLASAAAAGDVIAICPVYNYPALRYHATTPAGAAVVTTMDGTLARIEDGLGSNPDWDEVYFQKLIYPQTMAHIHGGDVSVSDLGVPGKLELQAGQSIWRVDGRCTEELGADMDRVLSAASPDPDVAWLQKSTSRVGAVSVRRYRVAAPITLDLQNLNAGQ
jgi:4-amino-4-deoxy-L-arabinose transferase-like glycosyltransferase